MSRASNDDIYSAIMDLKEDMGAVKATTASHLDTLQRHNDRLGVLEGASERQKGAVKVWGVVAASVATLVSGAIEFIRH